MCNYYSPLKIRPKSKVLKHGYINIYSELTPQEKRGLRFKKRYKQANSSWNDSLIILCDEFKKILVNKKGVPIRVLDAGCGHGNYIIDEFRSRIDWAVGVDLSPESTSKNICLDEIVYSNLTTLPFTDNAFDVCLFMWVLEHLEKPHSVLEEIYRILKPGGSLFFVTPNAKSILVGARKLIDERLNGRLLHKLYGRKEKYIFPVYYRVNKMGSLRKSLKKSGFTNVSIVANYDPSYTSFNRLTFKLSNFSDRLLSRLGSQLTKYHLVGTAWKPR